ncbi:hypothetical protein [Jatrophihabitans sp.]|nr:hypothetical protein [Jatrophihabitans sp.]
MRKGLFYGTGLIALYIAVTHGSNFGRVITSGANGGATFVKALQGR